MMMDFYKHTWLIAWETLRSLNKHYSPVMEQTAIEEDVNPDDWGMLITAFSFHPDEISEEILQKRIPYQRYANRLESMRHQGLLSRSGDLYQLTPGGEKIAWKVIQAAYQTMDQLHPLKPPEMHCLNQILRKIVLACLEAPEPPGKWCIKHARRLDPGESAGITVKLDQYLSDLVAYRDDSHLAAWRAHQVDGPTWETFDLFCKAEIKSLDELEERLQHRGYSSEEYQQAIELLIEKKWLERTKNQIQVTEHGENLRNQTEETTDQYFFTPWSVITDSEAEMLENLLQMVIIGLD